MRGVATYLYVVLSSSCIVERFSTQVFFRRYRTLTGIIYSVASQMSSIQYLYPQYLYPWKRSYRWDRGAHGGVGVDEMYSVDTPCRAYTYLSLPYSLIVDSADEDDRT